MNFTNWFLQVWSKVTKNCKPKRFAIPKEYKLIHRDNFNKIDMDYWLDYGDGFFITNDFMEWWDNTHAMSTENNTLNLDVQYKPKGWAVKNLWEYQKKELNYQDITENVPPVRVLGPFDQNVAKTYPNDLIITPYIRARLDSKRGYKYGIFKVDTKLPKGKLLWSSFWLCGIESWPPEIDVFEEHTSKKTIEPNVHYGTKTEHKQCGATNVAMKDKSDEWHETLVWWEKDFIKIYYDGKLVYKVTDKNILKWFDKDMSVILSSGTELWDPNNTDIEDKCIQPLMFRNFEIWQK